MRTRTGKVLLTLGVAVVCAWNVQAAEVDLDLDLAIRSPHVWRGITLREFSVLNVSSTARYKGFALQLWAGLDLGDGDGRRGEVQEIDVDLSHTWSRDRGDFTLGYIGLIFPDGIETTGEAYLKWQSRGWLSPRLEIYYNVDLLRDVFALVSVSHSWQTLGRLTPTATATVGYSGEEYAEFFGGSRSGLHHWGLQLDLDTEMAAVGVKFRLAYSDSLAAEVLPEQPVRYWGGLYLSFSSPVRRPAGGLAKE